MPKTKLPLGTKATFVRANPTLKAQELVALAKKNGLSLTAGHVYNIRAEDKKKAANGGQSPGASSLAGFSSPGATASLEAELRKLVFRVGLDRAESIFNGLKSSLSQVA